jgi:hypothetical protein
MHPRAALVLVLLVGCATTRAGTTTRSTHDAPPGGGAAGTPTAAAAQIPPPDPDGPYYATTTEMLTGKHKGPEGITLSIKPEEVDFARFRRGRFVASGRDGYGLERAELQRALDEAQERRDGDKVLAAADELLGRDFTDFLAHLAKAAVTHERGKRDTATFHEAMAMGLIKSILASGDGRGRSSAYRVFQVREEYGVLAVLGLRSEDQSLISERGRHFDQLRCTDRQGRSVTVFFDVTELFDAGADASKGAVSSSGPARP